MAGTLDQEAPLEGIRVIDFSNLLSGPMLTMYLADFGAEVIKVEHPRGDELRSWGHQRNGNGLLFKVVNRNKKMVTCNLSHPDGQTIARELAADADVVVENFRPGTMERWDLSYEELAAQNADLIMVRISGYGQEGPKSARPGFGTVAEAISGYAYISGYPERPPLLPAFALADSSTAIHGAFSVLLAIMARERGNGGQVVDLALYDGLLTMLGSQIVDYDQLGLVQERTGGRLPFVAPRRTYPTGDDKWIAIAGSTQATFERTVKALGLTELIDDDRFRSNSDRVRNAEELDRMIGDRTRQMRSEEVLSLLEEAGAVAGPVNSVEQVLSDPQVQHRQNVVTVDDDELGPVRMQNVVPFLTGTPGRVSHAARNKGHDNGAVYENLLDMNEETRERLAQHGTI